MSNTKITATPDEINQALDGIAADVTAANLSELTGGAETDLHSHAASGGGSGPAVAYYATQFSLTIAANADAHLNWNNANDLWDMVGFTTDGDGNFVVPQDGLYRISVQASLSGGTPDGAGVLTVDVGGVADPLNPATLHIPQVTPGATAGAGGHVSLPIQLTTADAFDLIFHYGTSGSAGAQFAGWVEMEYLRAVPA